jgi:hypothetical protein
MSKKVPEPPLILMQIVVSDIQTLKAASEKPKDVVGLLENGEKIPKANTSFDPVKGDTLSVK